MTIVIISVGKLQIDQDWLNWFPSKSDGKKEEERLVKSWNFINHFYTNQCGSSFIVPVASKYEIFIL